MKQNINICDLCIGLFLKLEGDCYCSLSSKCPYSNDESLQKAEEGFDNFIEEQVQAVKAMLKNGDVNPGDELEFDFAVTNIISNSNEIN